MSRAAGGAQGQGSAQGVGREALRERFFELLRGRLERWPREWDPLWGDALALAEVHGLAPLLHAWAVGEPAARAPLAGGAAVPAPGVRAQLPPEVVRRLQRMRAAELVTEARREAALHRALAALSPPGSEALRALLLKGAASARTLYAAPELRPRGDLDLLVAPAQFPEAVRRLEKAGYRHHPKVRGTPEELAGWHERTFVDPADPASVLDLHQELLQRERQALSAEGLIARSLPATDLGAIARLPSPEDALLSCAVSLAAHELGSPLVVACDVALLLQRCDLALLQRRAAEARVERALLLALAWVSVLLRQSRDAAQAAGADGVFCGVAVDRDRLTQGLGLTGVGGSAMGMIFSLAAAYDLHRRGPRRALQLFAKALLIDRPSDALRFLAATLRSRLQALV